MRSLAAGGVSLAMRVGRVLAGSSISFRVLAGVAAAAMQRFADIEKARGRGRRSC